MSQLTAHAASEISLLTVSLLPNRLGFYTMGNLMCQEALRFSFPMGDTSRLFRKKHVTEEKAE